MKNPCMDCPNVGCGVYHDQCPKYQEFRNNQLKDYERRKQISTLRADLSANVKRHLRISEHFYKKP